MSTTIKRIQFGSSAWVMRPDPPRAVMTIVVTVAGFDAHDLIPDLAHHLAESLAWGELYITIVPVDMVPLDTVDMDAFAARVGALVVVVDVNQPAPVYGEDPWSAVPNEAVVRVLLEQSVSANDDDREMLLERRRDLVRVLAAVDGTFR